LPEEQLRGAYALSYRRDVEWNAARMMRIAGMVGQTTIALFEAITHGTTGVLRGTADLQLSEKFGH